MLLKLIILSIVIPASCCSRIDIKLSKKSNNDHLKERPCLIFPKESKNYKEYEISDPSALEMDLLIQVPYSNIYKSRAQE